MVKYVCDTCKKEFERKQTYTQHIKKCNKDIPEKIHRLNYIGSKFQLLDWITNNMKEKTGWNSFANKRIGDIFSGTGIVSYHFRKHNACVISNDAELYSSIITHAFTRSIYTETCKNIIDEIQKDIENNKHLDADATIGFITTHYSPFELCERKFFTIENAKRIDYIRNCLELSKETLSVDEYQFILASILLSADAVSNVPAVYGCFLKNFKAKAEKNLTFTPIHNNTTQAVSGSNTYNCDVLNTDFITSFESDLVYLDPPYNTRQYSKNYFPLNIIAKTPEQLLTEMPLKGKTGIPTDCFISPFCKKGDVAEKAFDTLFSELKTEWIFLSYNSESIVSKEKMLDIMKKYGDASVIEKDYKRFKSFEYNKDVEIKEYLFCLKKT
jgi:adenine-specific DNA-methyltransferase